MIRPATPDDVEAIVAVWLRASIDAHDFVDPDIWREHESDMRDLYLPGAETYVEALGGRVIGFVSLVDDDLAALFVEPGHQAGGIGSALLAQAQSCRRRLALTVYVENERAVAFYQRRGFRLVGEQTDQMTGHRELRLAWSRDAT